MNWIRGKIARSLTFSFLLLASLVVATAFVAAYAVSLVRSDLTAAINRTNMALLGAQIRADSLDLVNLAQRYISPETDLAGQTQLLTRIQERRARLDSLIEQAVEATTAGDLQERTDLAHIQEQVVNLSLQVGRLIQAYDREQSYGEQTRQAMTILTLDYELPLTREISDFQLYEEERAQAAQARALWVGQLLVGGLSLAVLLVLALAGWMIYRSFWDIVMPITELNQVVGQLRSGHLDYPVNIYRQDEIGSLADALRSMAGRLQQTLAGLESNLAELQHTQQALERSEAHYRSLYQGVPVGLYRSGPDGTLMDVNSALVDMLRYPDRETLMSINAANLYVDGSDRLRWQEEMDRAARAHSFEARLRRCDGAIIWIREISHAVFDEQGQLLYYEGSLADVTDRKDAEDALGRLNAELEQRVRERTAELEAANTELEAFAYSVSHDLRAPLRGIDGYSKLLLDDYGAVLDENGQQYLANVRQATQRMGKLIDDLLKLSRVTRSEMYRTACNLSEIAAEVAAGLVQRWPEHQVRLEIQPDLIVQGDASLLRIMMDNLLGNAWKFTLRQEQALVEVGARYTAQEVIYFVRDNGAGFDMKYVGKLFGAFQRLHDPMDYEGTGIGLATVHRIIRRHGGRVWAEGSVGQGAVFYFTLPN